MPRIMGFGCGVDIGISATGRLSLFLGDKPVDDIAVVALKAEKDAKILFDDVCRMQGCGQRDERIIITYPYFGISIAGIESRAHRSLRHGFNRLHQRILPDLGSQRAIGRRIWSAGSYTKPSGQYEKEHVLHGLLQCVSILFNCLRAVIPYCPNRYWARGP